MKLTRDHHTLRRKLVREGMDPAKAFDFVKQKARDEQKTRKGRG